MYVHYVLVIYLIHSVHLGIQFNTVIKTDVAYNQNYLDSARSLLQLPNWLYP